MKKLKDKIEALQQQISNAEVINTAVSASSIGWHIEHALLTANLIITATAASNPVDYQWSFNLMRTVVFLRQRIPRGKAKAPKAVQPKNANDATSIQVQLDRIYQLLEILPTLNNSNFFLHPFFGKLNKQQTITFLNIHTAHHLAIIEDILRKPRQ